MAQRTHITTLTLSSCFVHTKQEDFSIVGELAPWLTIVEELVSWLFIVGELVS